MIKRSLAITLVLTLAAPAAQAQIDVAPIEQTTGDGVFRGLIARIDLTDPRTEIVVTAPTPGPEEAVRITTPDFAESEDLTLAVNANFFGWLDLPNADVIGLAKSNGQLISPPRSHDGAWDPALIFLPDNRAAVAHTTTEDAENAHNAVAGVGRSDTTDLAGSLLIENGKIKADSARVAPTKRHPRTCAGVSRNHKTLYLLVIDGRQPDWSVGATLPEAARILKDAGAHNALNLDGGGSTAFWYKPEGADSPQTNRPSGGAFRPVAVNLGFRLENDAEAEPTQPQAGQPDNR